MDKVLCSPTGQPITGTLETVKGVALISDGTVKQNADGSFDWEWAGDTKIWWDEQRTIYRQPEGEQRAAPQRVFVDDQGDEWLESELQLLDASEVYGEEAVA